MELQQGVDVRAMTVGHDDLS
jgi:hypothetical protein